MNGNPERRIQVNSLGKTVTAASFDHTPNTEVSMYVGRIVSIARNQSGKLCAMYRVSSRSFPNRMAKEMGKGIAIVPKPGHENDVLVNPYIAYNALRIVGSHAVVSNGSHTDPIAEKIEKGYPMRDALAAALLGMDYEHDTLSTPRIAAVVDRLSGKAALGCIRADALLIREFDVKPRQAFYLATYEHNSPCSTQRDDAFDVSNANEACGYILSKGVFAKLERPVSAICAVEHSCGFETACRDA